MNIHLEDNQISSLLGHNLENYQEHVDDHDVEYFRMWNYVQVNNLLLKYFCELACVSLVDIGVLALNNLG